MPKAAFHNLGCKVNAYETEAMQQQLAQRGYEIVPFDEKADVYLLCHQYRGPEITPDAPPGKKAQSSGTCGGSGMLCPGGLRGA